jgi:hypothetical protein
MRKRVAAVGAVGLLILGVWLGRWFRGPGLGGSGSGDGEPAAPPGEVQVNLDAGADGASGGVALAPDTPATTRPPSRADDVLTVLIDGESYQVQSGDDASARFTPATLEEVVERARTYPGDAHGVRVRLRHRRSSQEGARADLIEALQSAGIAREQVVEATEFVE